MNNSSLTRDILNVTKKTKGICEYNVEFVRSLIFEFMPNCEITRIEMSINQYLYVAFEIKRAEILKKCGDCKIKELLHATSAKNVKSILNENLNWRLIKRSKYGRGVSFTSDSKYANRYCNNRNGPERAFIICDVIIGIQRRVGDNNNYFPINEANTYCSRNGKVFVKFDDFTFYPKFVVYYSDSVPNLSSELRFNNFRGDHQLPAKSVWKNSERYKNRTESARRSDSHTKFASVSRIDRDVGTFYGTIPNDKNVVVSRNVSNCPPLLSYPDIQHAQILRDSQSDTASCGRPMSSNRSLTYDESTRPRNVLYQNAIASSHRSNSYGTTSSSTIHSSNSSRCNIF